METHTHSYSTRIWSLAVPEKAQELLQQHLQNKRLGQAYLFTGPAGIGTVPVARHFLRLVQESYGEKPSATELTIVERAEGKQDITVEQIRELRTQLRYRSVHASPRMGLIINAHRLNTPAMNALLKTLEEPAGNVLVALTSDDTNSLLPTVRSRLWTVQLRLTPVDALAQALQEEYRCTTDEALEAASLAQGRPERAAALLESNDERSRLQQSLDAFLGLFAATPRERLRLLDTCLPSEKRFIELQDQSVTLLRFWKAITRDLLLLRERVQPRVRFAHAHQQLVDTAKTVTRERLLQLMDRCDEALSALQRNANPRLAIEHCALYL